MIKFLDWINEKKKETEYEYSCAMIFYDLPIIKEIHKAIDPNDIYTEEDKFGLETETHTTILYGLHDDEIKPEDVIAVCQECDYSDMVAHNISLFENDKYDVLKLDIESKLLHEVNGKLVKKFPFTNSFPKYHPHCTVGYLKPGTGKKYLEQFSDVKEEIIPTQIVYSRPSGEKIYHKIKKEDN